MTEPLFLLLALSIIVSYVLLTGGERPIRPRLRELDEARDQAIRDIQQSANDAMEGFDNDLRRRQ